MQKDILLSASLAPKTSANQRENGMQALTIKQLVK